MVTEAGRDAPIVAHCIQNLRIRGLNPKFLSKKYHPPLSAPVIDADFEGITR